MFTLKEWLCGVALAALGYGAVWAIQIAAWAAQGVRR